MKLKKKKRIKIEKIYSKVKFIKKFFQFIKWKFKDAKELRNNPDLFRDFGLTMFTGRQGARQDYGYGRAFGTIA